MSAPESKSEVVLGLAEEFLDRYRRGERPPLKEYADRHPDLAAEIHEVFPAMALMENIALADESIGADPASRERPAGPQQLGDFRIIREVGQGGMGIVYEAEQVSLGRHIALKVLPRQVIRDAKLRQRFEREAKSAAKLHHTNIVPVYGVGEHDGTPYYVMQFIQGLGLDEVIAELARMAPSCAPPTDSEPVHRSGAARAAARSLMTGQFGAAVQSDRGEKPAPAKATLTAAGELLNPLSVETPVTGSGHAAATRRVDTAVLSSVTLPGQSESAIDRKSKRLTYWQSVARVGVQVADALEHAHRQGVIHRDIKPSNLLLDLAGTVWVTDFGLAKANDQQNLTHTGDILGTLRYMPPEAFDGRADARGDIYSLGLTLYELVALRPAFDQKDRLRLVKQVTEEEPQSLRKLRPDVPRDLETIIAKATEKAVVHRYESAAELAADLQRFLDDEPIHARPSTTWERAWRWRRRNPVVAALTAAVAALLVVLAVGSSVAALYLRSALAESEHDRRRAERAEQDQREQLWQAYLERARAGRWSGRPGRRIGSLEALAEAARIRPAAELRDEAIAALALTDLRIGKMWEGFREETNVVEFAPSVEQYARTDAKGNISIRSVADDQEITILNRLGGSPARVLQFSASGHFLAAKYTTADTGPCRVWDLERKVKAFDVPGGAYLFALDFSPDDRLLAVGKADGSIIVYDVATGQPAYRLDRQIPPHTIAFHPGGKLLAVSSRNSPYVQVRELESGRVVYDRELRHGGAVRGLSWRSDGEFLAAACADSKVYVWKMTGKPSLYRTLVGHDHVVVQVAFNRHGDLLASSDWDLTVHLWDPLSGESLIHAVGTVGKLVFSPDDRRLAKPADGSRVGYWDVAHGPEFYAVHMNNKHINRHADIRPDGRLMAVNEPNGVSLWDVQTRRQRAHLPGPEGIDIAFLHDGKGLLATSAAGLCLWPIASDGPDGGIRIGPPQILYDGPCGLMSLSRDGRAAIVQTTDRRALVFKLERPGEPVILDGHPKVHYVAIGPDGAWAATGSWGGKGVKIWDARTGKLAHELSSISGSATVSFSPDGRWLITSTGADYQFWEVGTWRPMHRLTRQHAVDIPGSVAFGGLGNLMAVNNSPTSVRLIETENGRVVATFEAPHPQHIAGLCFDRQSRLLLATCQDYVHVWDLALLRHNLAELKLDWDGPETPAAPASDGKPLEVHVVLAQGKPASPVPGEADRLALESLYREGKYKEAIAAGIATVKAAPNVKSTYLTLSDAYYRVGEFDQAAAAARRHLDLCPDCPMAVTRLAKSQVAAGDHGAAVQTLERALQANSNRAALYDSLAWLYLTGPVGVRNAEKALPLAQKAVALAPTNTIYQLTLGAIYYRLGKFDQAVEILSAMKPGTAKSTSALTQLFLAMSYHRLGKADLAAASYRQAPPPSPDDRIDPQMVKEIESIRAEAAALLGVK